jgi:tRNA nucleotidyltransferase/poly(A) polymerase
MPDYMYLLESRLSPEQRAALERVQELSRAQDLNIYLTGGAVRDLISGQPIRDLDFTVEGNPVKMVRELEKGGARVPYESERQRHYEILFAGDADGSISAAREDVYERPGTKPEIRFAGIMEDLRRRDFSINAIAISLNAQSRGLLLDPTNGLADLERQEVRALTIHSFTNQPIRLMRILRYCARMGFKMEARTQEWFDLAFERGLQQNLEGADVGGEIRAAAREESPVAILKQWETRGLLASAHPQLQKRRPDYESLSKLSKVRVNLVGAGVRPRLQVANTYYIFSRLKSREAAGAMKHLEFRASEIDAVGKLVPEAQKVAQTLKGRKMTAPRDAYAYLTSLPPETLAFIEVELPNPAALSKIRAYVQKWRPLRLSLPAGELDALGVPRGPKFDKILEQLFEAQLRGKGKTPEDRTKRLRQYAGIKEDPKKKPEKEKKVKGKEGEPPPPAAAPKGKPTSKQAAPPAQGKPAGNAPTAATPTAAGVASNPHKPSAPPVATKPKDGKRKAGGR